MTIASIVGIIIIGICGLALTGLLFWGATQEQTGGYAIGAAVTFVLTLCLCFGIAWYQTNTEAGKRALKDEQSNLHGGITRTVEVYDVNGQMIKTYEGRFDIETDKDNYILFDDEDGNRHIIYFTTGTIIIDEKE